MSNYLKVKIKNVYNFHIEIIKKIIHLFMRVVASQKKPKVQI